MPNTFDATRIIENGLPTVEGTRKTVIIIGAGMAGLSAAYELIKQGHQPVILEARNRSGGRILTLRAPFADGLHAEAGAMRIPDSHNLTLHYCREFGLELVPFTMGNPKCYYFLQGKKYCVGDCKDNPGLLPYEFPEHEQGKTITQLWGEVLKEFTDELAEKGESAWDDIVKKYDEYSIREFLEKRGWSENAMELFGLLENQEAEMNFSFIEMVREEIKSFDHPLYQIVGGTDRLPLALYGRVKNYVRFGAVVTAINQDDDSVAVHYKTRSGRFTAHGDHLINTMPFPALRHVEILKPFSRAKQKAIRQLHYDASCKIFFQCRRRFWEEDEGIFGGGSVTDLAIRNLYYPEHGRETGRGVLLASYTWAADAERWGSLTPDDRIEQALEDVAQIHPQITQEFEAGYSYSWHNDEFAGGAFALFEPGQQTRLYDTICAPEGRIHFAGEHASLAHAWIQGAIESGLRAAWEVNEARDTRSD